MSTTHRHRVDRRRRGDPDPGPPSISVAAYLRALENPAVLDLRRLPPVDSSEAHGDWEKVDRSWMKVGD